MSAHSGKFDVGVYNREARAAVKDNRSHDLYSDYWADVHWIEIEAKDKDDALAIIGRRYPADRGFVVTEVVPVRDA